MPRTINIGNGSLCLFLFRHTRTHSNDEGLENTPFYKNVCVFNWFAHSQFGWFACQWRATAEPFIACVNWCAMRSPRTSTAEIYARYRCVISMWCVWLAPPPRPSSVSVTCVRRNFIHFFSPLSFGTLQFTPCVRNSTSESPHIQYTS